MFQTYNFFKPHVELRWFKKKLEAVSMINNVIFDDKPLFWKCLRISRIHDSLLKKVFRMKLLNFKFISQFLNIYGRFNFKISFFFGSMALWATMSAW